MFRFEKLDVWQHAIEFAGRAYAVTRAFPENERYGLTSQLRRAAVSISSNVVEGSGRNSDTEFARYIEIAYASLMEVVSQATIAHRQGFMHQQAFDELYQASERLARMLSGLRSSLVSRKSYPSSGS